MADEKELKELLKQLKDHRLASGIKAEEVDAALGIGEGWTEAFEGGDPIPELPVLTRLLKVLDVEPGGFFTHLDVTKMTATVPRSFAWKLVEGEGLRFQFPYGRYKAIYTLANASTEQAEQVVSILRRGLALSASGKQEESRRALMNAVSDSFLKAIELWPTANPSDIWWFVIYRAFCDPFNHPAKNRSLDFEQSWKRTGGWAFEDILQRHYGPTLHAHGIVIRLANQEKNLPGVLAKFNLDGRQEADKVDLLLLGLHDGVEEPFGVVHVKASFAERRTDDIPLSESLVAKGYCSPLCTLDAKSKPHSKPVNRGELGPLLDQKKDKRSAKRKDIEEGRFSAGFSYNANTLPTPEEQNAKGNVVVCNFANPVDAFSRYVISFWEQFKTGRLGQ